MVVSSAIQGIGAAPASYASGNAVRVIDSNDLPVEDPSAALKMVLLKLGFHVFGVEEDPATGRVTVIDSALTASDIVNIMSLFGESNYRIEFSYEGYEKTIIPELLEIKKTASAKNAAALDVLISELKRGKVGPRDGKITEDIRSAIDDILNEIFSQETTSKTLQWVNALKAIKNSLKKVPGLNAENTAKLKWLYDNMGGLAPRRIIIGFPKSEDVPPGDFREALKVLERIATDIAAIAQYVPKENAKTFLGALADATDIGKMMLREAVRTTAMRSVTTGTPAGWIQKLKCGFFPDRVVQLADLSTKLSELNETLFGRDGNGGLYKKYKDMERRVPNAMTEQEFQELKRGMDKYNELGSQVNELAGYLNSEVIDSAFVAEFQRQFTELAGRPLELTDPYTGQPLIPRSVEDLFFDKSGGELRVKVFKPGEKWTTLKIVVGEGDRDLLIAKQALAKAISSLTLTRDSTAPNGLLMFLAGSQVPGVAGKVLKVGGMLAKHIPGLRDMRWISGDTSWEELRQTGQNTPKGLRSRFVSFAQNQTAQPMNFDYGFRWRQQLSQKGGDLRTYYGFNGTLTLNNLDATLVNEIIKHVISTYSSYQEFYKKHPEVQKYLKKINYRMLSKEDFVLTEILPALGKMLSDNGWSFDLQETHMPLMIYSSTGPVDPKTLSAGQMEIMRSGMEALKKLLSDVYAINGAIYTAQISGSGGYAEEPVEDVILAEDSSTQVSVLGETGELPREGVWNIELNQDSVWGLFTMPNPLNVKSINHKLLNSEIKRLFKTLTYLKETVRSAAEFKYMMPYGTIPAGFFEIYEKLVDASFIGIEAVKAKLEGNDAEYQKKRGELSTLRGIIFSRFAETFFSFAMWEYFPWFVMKGAYDKLVAGDISGALADLTVTAVFFRPTLVRTVGIVSMPFKWVAGYEIEAYDQFLAKQGMTVRVPLEMVRKSYRTASALFENLAKEYKVVRGAKNIMGGIGNATSRGAARFADNTGLGVVFDRNWRYDMIGGRVDYAMEVAAEEWFPTFTGMYRRMSGTGDTAVGRGVGFGFRQLNLESGEIVTGFAGNGRDWLALAVRNRTGARVSNLGRRAGNWVAGWGRFSNAVVRAVVEHDLGQIDHTNLASYRTRGRRFFQRALDGQVRQELSAKFVNLLKREFLFKSGPIRDILASARASGMDTAVLEQEILQSIMASPDVRMMMDGMARNLVEEAMEGIVNGSGVKVLNKRVSVNNLVDELALKIAELRANGKSVKEAYAEAQKMAMQSLGSDRAWTRFLQERVRGCAGQFSGLLRTHKELLLERMSAVAKSRIRAISTVVNELQRAASGEAFDVIVNGVPVRFSRDTIQGLINLRLEGNDIAAIIRKTPELRSFFVGHPENVEVFEMLRSLRRGKVIALRNALNLRAAMVPLQEAEMVAKGAARSAAVTAKTEAAAARAAKEAAAAEKAARNLVIGGRLVPVAADSGTATAVRTAAATAHNAREGADAAAGVRVATPAAVQAGKSVPLTAKKLAQADRQAEDLHSALSRRTVLGRVVGEDREMVAILNKMKTGQSLSRVEESRLIGKLLKLDWKNFKALLRFLKANRGNLKAAGKMLGTLRVLGMAAGPIITMLGTWASVAENWGDLRGNDAERRVNAYNTVVKDATVGVVTSTVSLAAGFGAGLWSKVRGGSYLQAYRETSKSMDYFQDEVANEVDSVYGISKGTKGAIRAADSEFDSVADWCLRKCHSNTNGLTAYARSQMAG